ncbi:uncharacterized protein N7469_001248 [Penicillium citrinum]|uniref:Uncharacterized protein n=2 Tax=Penicillium TaxID=5073 RepID=A0A9W9TVJ3_PENCI|nr:uncharacterized protein N7469_001248 [Penicillium citrinum]KAJ5242921.1 hypothetical protein N7469_001248 [Penicillium citrinum]KAJ5599572.1 hypothetical protein N7450_000639 [Penicillium hetheringtonii]KAK5806459.1 hypothetical protein VI817_000717 [Penicillium citrinum]
MSSQLPGRQSPDPERLTGSQQKDVPGSGKIDESLGARPAPEFAQQKSEENKRNSLPSNPEHPLEKAEAAKYAK